MIQHEEIGMHTRVTDYPKKWLMNEYSSAIFATDKLAIKLPCCYKSCP